MVWMRQIVDESSKLPTTSILSTLQGLHFVRRNHTAPCFVYPTYHKFEDGTNLMHALERGLREIVDVDIAWVVPLSDNLIPDARFAPVESSKYCDRYQWAYVDHYIICE